MPEQVKPTIGRIVHYQKQYLDFDGRVNNYVSSSKTVAAIIVAVDEEKNLATLYVLDYNSRTTRFEDKVGFSEEPQMGCWNWPPSV